jgi:hypothetical protein
MKLRIAIIAALFVLAGAWLRASHENATLRQNLAASWDSPSADFAAVGLRGENLVAFLPDGDNIECYAFLGSVLTDKPIVDSLRAEGFREISCGQRKSRL